MYSTNDSGILPQFQVESHLNWELWFSSYVATYLKRDVRNIKSISDLGRFQTFISSLAARAGQRVNMSDVAGECGISEPTVKDWLSILESTYLIYLLRPFHSNRIKRLVKTPKVYFVDTGLLCYLLGIDAQNRFLRSRERGHIFENMVVTEFIKRASQMGRRKDFFFYRTSNDVEVDLIVEEKGELYAYEIKFAKTLRREMTNPIVAFIKDHPVKKAALLSLNENETYLAHDVISQHWAKALKEH